MYSDYYETLIHKHLAGELTREEESALKEWLEDSPGNREHLEEAMRVWDLAGIVEADPGVNLSIDLEHEIARFEQRARVGRKNGLRLVWRYAAAAVVLIGAILFFWIPGEEAMVHVKTASNETLSVTLPDGSAILLNENSQISYLADFSERQVEMSGEVFFEVQQDPSRPFRILSDLSLVEVLGTSFVIRNRLDEPDVRVTVSTGSVAFSIPETQQREVLGPGFAGRISRETNTLTVSPNRNPDYQVWRNRSLTFDATPLSSVIEELRIHFGIVMNAPSEALASCTFTGDFIAPRLDEVLEVLSFSIDLQVSLENGVYEVSGIGCMQ